MRRGCGQGEAIAAWAVWALLLVVVAVTYARVPVAELYRVSNDGLAGGLGRAVVLSNYPIALMAIALVLIAVAALPRRAWWAAAPAIVLCSATAFAVDPSALDVRAVNALPAVGVVVAVALTAAAASRAGASFVPRLPGDPARLVLGGVVVLSSLPWFAADLGTYFPGDIFLTRTVVTEGNETLAAVHVGHHHGVDGAMLVLTALLLSRARPPGRRLRAILTAYVALMFAYGGVNAAEDVWHEQVIKRRWVDWRIPAAQVPSLSFVWLAILALAAVAYLVFAREQRRCDGAGGAVATPSTSPSAPEHP
jgi:hypothetical protein